MQGGRSAWRRGSTYWIISLPSSCLFFFSILCCIDPKIAVFSCSLQRACWPTAFLVPLPDLLLPLLKGDSSEPDCSSVKLQVRGWSSGQHPTQQEWHRMIDLTMVACGVDMFFLWVPSVASLSPETWTWGGVATPVVAWGPVQGPRLLGSVPEERQVRSEFSSLVFRRVEGPVFLVTAGVQSWWFQTHAR